MIPKRQRPVVRIVANKIGVFSTQYYSVVYIYSVHGN